MIAQVIFDLPLDGPFDYLIPEHLATQIAVGSRVKVSFGPRSKSGFVVGVLAQSTVVRLKAIQSMDASGAGFNDLDLGFAKEFSGYYGCSLGEALATMFRNKESNKPSFRREHKPRVTLYTCRPDQYALRIQEIIDKYRGSAGASRFLVLVPDAFRAELITQKIQASDVIRIGTRSSVFECDGQYDCVFMVDEEDPSYKQEQMPMYETRQVLLARSRIFGFDVVFVGICPSVELVSLVLDQQVKYFAGEDLSLPNPRLVDLTNYKFVPGMISPPVRDALEGALKAGKKSILVLNRKGSYRLTRCVDCSEVLKCSHCDSPLIYSRSEAKYQCRHCHYSLPGDTVCPKCLKPSWRSQGIGVEQLQAELKKLLPLARIQAFERTAKTHKKNTIGDFDILIATQAVLRFQGKWQASVAAFVDFDAELNRLDMRGAFNAFSLIRHISSMVTDTVMVQTRNIGHYVLEHLSRADTEGFYDEELKLRKEFGFSPFKHWVKLSWRGKSEKSAYHAAQQVYNEMAGSAPYTITPPLADTVVRKRDWFRFNVMIQAEDVPGAMSFIKSTLAGTKRPGRVIVTLNVDP